VCGPFTFQPTEAFYERIQISNRLDSLIPRYNIGPGQMVPVIIANSPRRIVFMCWGLIPVWSKNSCGFTLIVFQQPPELFAIPNRTFTPPV
jgi:putative SOS response-associated peptidase YedK